jgi:hypothetical protein
MLVNASAQESGKTVVQVPEDYETIQSAIDATIEGN